MSQEKFYDKFTQKKTSPKKDKSKKTAKDFTKSENPVKKYNSEKKTETKSKINIISSLFGECSKLTDDSKNILNNFDDIIQGVKPLNSKQKQQLPENIKNLSHQLTDLRSERRLGYMNDNQQLSSYVRYFTWWNLVRLTKLFSTLDSTCFPEKDCHCIDIGSGPLTVVIALWLSRPELRKLNLVWYCLDVSSASLSLGENIFLSIVAKTGENPWKIIKVKDSFGTYIKEKCSFITSANVLNELDQASTMPPEFQSKKYYEEFSKYKTDDAKFILIEPGIPKAARTLSLLRERFIKDDYTVSYPCPHSLECPMNGFKAYTGSSNKWCNFAFTTEDAPAKLLKLSEKAKLPKERATLSFIAAQKINLQAKNENTLKIRIISDEFKLPKFKSGYYGCSELGLTLVSISDTQKLKSGDLITVKKEDSKKYEKDSKSGAAIIEL